MRLRHGTSLLYWLLLLLLGSVLSGCGTDERSFAPEDDVSPLRRVVPPCTPFPASSVDPCARRDQIPSFTPHISVTYQFPEVVESLEDLMIKWAPSPYWGTQFIVRATVIPGSTRCGPAVLGVSHFLAYDVGASAQAHYESDCYVDLAVNEYIVGGGPARIVAITGPNPYGAGVEQSCDQLCRDEGARRVQGTGIEGVEWIMFLGGPSHLGQGAWGIVGVLDVQRKQDGTVVVVNRNKGVILDHSLPENYAVNASRLEQSLDEFRKTATEAFMSFVELTGGLTGTANDSEGRLPPRIASDAGNLGFNDYMARTRLIEGTPAPPPPVPGENDPNPGGLRINDIIATRVAGGVAIPGGLEGTAIPVSALGDEPTATAAEEVTSTP